MSDTDARSGRPQLGLADYVDGLRSGDRTVLARAITLIESRRGADQELAQAVLQEALGATGKSIRLGISGVPGVGKSTFIEALGTRLTDAGHRVAVLAVDPSSSVSGGSILGDKSRMPKLATDPRAFIRPSPDALTPGGVGRRTRESLLLCEAAGYDVVMVETVGVGQSETLVAQMVDTFVVLLLAGAGDELQGIKKGILELADILAINKADGANREAALAGQQEYRAALRYLPSREIDWQTPVLAVSGLTGDGLETLWQTIEDHRQTLQRSGLLTERRSRQNRHWMWSTIEERLRQAFADHPQVRQRLERVERAVLDGSVSPTQGATELLELFAGPGRPDQDSD